MRRTCFIVNHYGIVAIDNHSVRAIRISIRKNDLCLIFYFGSLLEKGFDATKSATLLLGGFKTLERDGVNTRLVEEKDIVLVLDAERKGKLSRKAMLEAMKKIAGGIPADCAIESLKLDRLGSGELERVVSEIIEKNSKMAGEKGMRAVNALMGDAMKALKGKATGKEVMHELAEQIGKKVK